MKRAMVALPALPAPIDELWHVLLNLGDNRDLPWTLVGGQMVLLHALEHGQVPPQISQDGDVVADVRAAPHAVGALVAALRGQGFTVDGMSPTGLAHRYLRPGLPRPRTVTCGRAYRVRSPWMSLHLKASDCALTSPPPDRGEL